MDKSDDARENSIRSGFMSADTEAHTHRKRVSQRVNGEIHTKLCRNVSFDEYSRKHS